MNANKLRFWMLAEQRQWRCHTLPGSSSQSTLFDLERMSLRLADHRPPSPLKTPLPAVARNLAEAHLEFIPQAIDQFGTWAFWDDDTNSIMATGAISDLSAEPILTLSEAPTDLVMGYDDILYIATGESIIMLDRRSRWPAETVQLAGFLPWRLAADPAGGVWALDPDNHQLGRLQGEPLPDRAGGTYDAGTFRPVVENPNPPRLTAVTKTSARDAETPVAVASNEIGGLALLFWDDLGNAFIKLLQPDYTLSAPMMLNGAAFPYSFSWVNPHSIALMLLQLPTEAPVYDVVLDLETEAEGIALESIGDFYPLREHDGRPFLKGITFPPHYPSETQVHPLHHLSLPAYPTAGTASSKIPLDSGKLATAWHRLYIEACIPPDCGIKLFLAATDEPAPPAWSENEAENIEWHEHRFGKKLAKRTDSRIPLAAWVPAPSEIPHHPGLLKGERKIGSHGLFTTLIMRPKQQVSTLRGRYLHVRAILLGEGRTTPEIFAVRAYGSRFSYIENYLPALYREKEFGQDADLTNVKSTPPDFLERFLNNFEGILTRLEDQIAASYLLTDPRSAPQETLSWLGKWIGMTFEEAPSEHIKRRLLMAAPELYRRRGTLKGLAMALNIACNGAVGKGHVLIVENWRLRRTFATILGADLADEDDPLTMGLAVSGNSYVGDTLFLGDEDDKDFLALFSPEVIKKDQKAFAKEEQAIKKFLNSQSYRVTILVHQAVNKKNMGLIRRIAELHTPAHLAITVVAARYSFLVGVAGLIGIDTLLLADEPPEPVRVEHSTLGVRDLLQRPASLDPRLEGSWLG